MYKGLGRVPPLSPVHMQQLRCTKKKKIKGKKIIWWAVRKGKDREKCMT